MSKIASLFLFRIRAISAAFMLACALLLALPAAALAAGQTAADNSTADNVEVELEGIKYLKDREWKDGETFTFQLEGQGNAPMPEKANGENPYKFEVGRTDTNLNIGTFGVFVTYDKPGTYIYKLSEVPGNARGMTYDGYVSTITVKVTGGGDEELVAEKTVEARTGIEAEAGVSGFVNKYSASMTYPGLTVEKTLHGRDMSFGEFNFTITPENPNAKYRGVSETDASFESGAHQAGETCSMTGKLSGLAFNQEDAGKEFIYTVSEVLPSDDDAQHEGVQHNGVTYDGTEYWVVIVPIDNGDGTMHATTKIYTEDVRSNLVGEWSSDDTAVPTVSFVNRYVEDDPLPDTGGDPTPGAGDGNGDLAQTGDGLLSKIGMFALLAVAAAGVAMAARSRFRAVSRTVHRRV